MCQCELAQQSNVVKHLSYPHHKYVAAPQTRPHNKMVFVYKSLYINCL